MRQIIRFAFVGGSAFVIDYGVMILLTELIGINYLISSGISFSVSVIYNYILSVHWVFDVAEDRSKRAEFVIFIILSVIGLGINQLVMWIAVDIFRMFYMIAKIGATAIVMVYNFIRRKSVSGKIETETHDAGTEKCLHFLWKSSKIQLLFIFFNSYDGRKFSVIRYRFGRIYFSQNSS